MWTTASACPRPLDNRPLQFDEFRSLLHQVVYVSATPGKYEMDQSQGIISEQIIRPTGLVDPEVEVRPTKGQMEDLLGECRERIRRGERVLVTTLTKRMAEDLTEYCCTMGINARYLHSDIDTLERLQIIRALRQGEFDVLVGINLLREGLDIPEVSLVCILDTDKEGFLRSTGSLIQTFTVRRAMSTDTSSCMPIRSRPPCARPWTRPNGAGPSRPPITRSTASRRGAPEKP